MILWLSLSNTPIMLCRNEQECSCWNFLVLFCYQGAFQRGYKKKDWISLTLPTQGAHFWALTLVSSDPTWMTSGILKSLLILLYVYAFIGLSSLSVDLFFFPNRLETHFSTFIAKTWYHLSKQFHLKSAELFASNTWHRKRLIPVCVLQMLHVQK